MLLVVRAGEEAAVKAVFDRYDLHAVVIGRVIGEPVVRATAGGSVVCEVPGRALADDAPRYTPPAAPPADLAARRAERLDDLAAEPPTAATLLELLASPNVRSRQADLAALRPHERDEHAGRTRRGDAALLRVKGTSRALALSLDGPGRDRRAGSPPRRRRRRGGGGAQRGMQRCDPDRDHQLPELRIAGAPGGLLGAAEAVAGMAEACVALASRSCPATSASTTRRQTARSSRRRWSARSGCSTTAPRPSRCAGPRLTRSGCSVRRPGTPPPWPRRSSPGGAAGSAEQPSLDLPRGAAGGPARRARGARHPGRSARRLGRRAGGGAGADGDRVRRWSQRSSSPEAAVFRARASSASAEGEPWLRYRAGGAGAPRRG